VSRIPPALTGLEAILEIIDRRFEYDPVGRIVGARNDGVMPRFVLGRSSEGCVWRFAASLDRALVVQVAKLAGREPGFPNGDGVPYSPPERWVMIERLFGASGPANPNQTVVRLGTSHEELTRNGVIFGEIWTLV
jgi:hypothetical protein